MQKLLCILVPIVALVGCSGEESSDRTMTSAEMTQKVQETKATMPPEAQAAMAQSGRYGGGSSDYSKSMEQAQKK